MGEAKRRREIAARQEAGETRYSEPWMCPNCSAFDEDEDYWDLVIYKIVRGVASCMRCGYGGYRKQFGFATTKEMPCVDPKMWQPLLP